MKQRINSLHSVAAKCSRQRVVWAAIAMALSAGVAAAQDIGGFHRGGTILDQASIPSGTLLKDLSTLSPDAKQAALRILSRISFPKLDAITSMRTDKRGAVYYVDRITDSQRSVASVSKSASADRQLNIDPTKVFSLHSKPLSANRVYLNFRGERIAGTALNFDDGVAVYRMRPFSLDGKQDQTSQDEANIIAEVWKNVSEDLSPFNIDVTTERPAKFGPTTAHVLISPRIDANGRAVADENTGGFGYVDVWGMSNFTYFQPALVFSDNLSNNAKFMSEAASHEFGHNLSLSHDGRTSPSEEYYRGHGSGSTSWGPIMGAGYNVNVTQWSKGEYAGANNNQDDVALIAARLGVSPDDHANSLAGATALRVVNGTVSVTPIDPENADPYNKGILGKRRDVDYFYFDAPQAGTVALTITPDWIERFRVDTYRASNADIRASLYNASGGLLAKATSPKNTQAQLNAAVSPGRYYVLVEGVGTGTVSGTGYSDYGSLGRYFISGRIPAPSNPAPAASPSVEVASSRKVGGPQ